MIHEPHSSSVLDGHKEQQIREPFKLCTSEAAFIISIIMHLESNKQRHLKGNKITDKMMRG